MALNCLKPGFVPLLPLFAEVGVGYRSMMRAINDKRGPVLEAVKVDAVWMSTKELFETWRIQRAQWATRVKTAPRPQTRKVKS